MISKNSDTFKPEIIHPNSREYKKLVSDLAKREQSLEPHSQVARHPKYPHVYATDAGQVINAWNRSKTKPAHCPVNKCL